MDTRTAEDTPYYCPVSGETQAEERMNYLTHLFGFILSIFGTIFLVNYAAMHGSLHQLISSSIYGLTLVLLYAASTFYHRAKDLSQKKKFRMCDHACIYLLIAGSYTPFTLGPLLDKGGLDMQTFIWAIAIIGAVHKLIAFEYFKNLSLIAYLAMGWLVVFNLPELIESLPITSSALLIAGGLFYSIGTIFFARESMPFNHAIWHVFVLVGSVCHYFSIFTILTV